MIHNNNFLSLVEEYRPLIKEVDVEHVKTKLDNKEDFTLIDVREDHEWNRGHIPTAIHMARGIIEINIEKIIPQKDTHIVLYCGGGFRSVLSAYNLQKMGYNNVVSMDGGISTWINFGYNITL